MSELDHDKLDCRCPSCGHAYMHLTVCDEEPREGEIGFACRGCGAEWEAAEARRIEREMVEEGRRGRRRGWLRQMT